MLFELDNPTIDRVSETCSINYTTETKATSYQQVLTCRDVVYIACYCIVAIASYIASVYITGANILVNIQAS